MADELITDDQHVVKKLPENRSDSRKKDSDLSLSSDQSCAAQQKKHVLLLPDCTVNDFISLSDNYQNQPLPPPMTSSIISLASPVDSGVALIDSDFDNTSVSEATFDNDKNEVSLFSKNYWVKSMIYA